MNKPRTPSNESSTRAHHPNAAQRIALTGLALGGLTLGVLFDRGQGASDTHPGSQTTAQQIDSQFGTNYGPDSLAVVTNPTDANDEIALAGAPTDKASGAVYVTTDAGEHWQQVPITDGDSGDRTLAVDASWAPGVPSPNGGRLFEVTIYNSTQDDTILELDNASALQGNMIVDAVSTPAHSAGIATDAQGYPHGSWSTTDGATSYTVPLTNGGELTVSN